MASILVTDDASFMRTILRDILTKNGHTVTEASNGKECVNALKSNDFDLVTLDITMPEMNGLQALKVIKGFKPTQKVIMLSAMGQQAMVIEAIRNGAMDFVVKPFEAERVITAVNKALL